MITIIDIGNSRIKFAQFVEGEIQLHGVGESELFKLDLGETPLFISASGGISDELQAWLDAQKNVRYISRKLDWPFELDYLTPQTLGFDRIADVAASIALNEGVEHILTIDVGSAITYNYVDSFRLFKGGNISLGVGMRFKALHHYTANLPMVQFKEGSPIIGRSTTEAIHAGVIQGVVNEVSGYAHHFLANHPDGRIVVTGGGYLEIAEQLEFAHHYDGQLGLRGLHEIFVHNWSE